MTPGARAARRAGPAGTPRAAPGHGDAVTGTTGIDSRGIDGRGVEGSGSTGAYGTAGTAVDGVADMRVSGPVAAEELRRRRPGPGEVSGPVPRLAARP